MFLTSCATYKGTNNVSKNNIIKSNSNKGLVLFSVNWGRKWGCGGYENAELREIGFDKLPLDKPDDKAAPDLVINGPPRLMTTPTFTNYLLELEPSQYAISYIKIKVAKSVSDVGYLTFPRSSLFEDEKPIGGYFSVSKNEKAYIGNFWLDCVNSPMLWRYYTKTKKGFDKHMKEFSIEYPALEFGNVKYRLFKTKEFGFEYSLDED